MTQSVETKIQSIDQIAINVHATSRAVEFYRDVSNSA